MFTNKVCLCFINFFKEKKNKMKQKLGGNGMHIKLQG